MYGKHESIVLIHHLTNLKDLSNDVSLHAQIMTAPPRPSTGYG